MEVAFSALVKTMAMACADLLLCAFLAWCGSREELSAEVVQPVGPQDQQEGLQRGGGGEADGCSQTVREQMGYDCQVLPW